MIDRFVEFNFNGKPKRVYKNAHLSVFVDGYCNADCQFCLEQLAFETRMQAHCKDHIASDKDYYLRLRHVLDYLSPLRLSVGITGGEPTLSYRTILTIPLFV